jgi:hypothetical protein
MSQPIEAVVLGIDRGGHPMNCQGLQRQIRFGTSGQRMPKAMGKSWKVLESVGKCWKLESLMVEV